MGTLSDLGAGVAGLWERVNQRLHEVVDRALDAQSLALYDQYLRDVESYGRQIEESAATMYAGIQANRRRLERHEAELARLTARVDGSLAAGEVEQARLRQADLAIQQELVETTRGQIVNQEADRQRLLGGREEAFHRLQLMEAERPSVEALLAMIRAGRLAEQIELTLAGLAQLGAESAAGRVASGIRQRLDEAEARWQLVAGRLGIDPGAEAVEEAQVGDQLAERMRRLGLDPDERPSDDEL
jgi:phage shock protein A